MYGHSDVWQILSNATPTAVGTAHSTPSIRSTLVGNILENLAGANSQGVGHQIIIADVTFTMFNT
jgi:hypothetical protein